MYNDVKKNFDFDLCIYMYFMNMNSGKMVKININDIIKVKLSVRWFMCIKVC